MAVRASSNLKEFVREQIWLADYPVRLGGARFNARMTVVKRSDGGLVVHSPGPLDDATHAEVEALGRVAVIVAPGNFHHMHVAECQRRFPEAETWTCPGVEKKQPTLTYDGVLTRAPVPALADFEMVLVAGRLMSEVAMFHKPSRTLLLVDLIEHFTNATAGTNWALKAWWTLFGMWDKAVPAPEYRFGFRDCAAASAALEQILAWDFERIVIAHGDLIEQGARDVARRAWRGYLSKK